ncbi:MAG: autotransporter outer membrane beta-barrel domain-containing protein, partial [Thermoanaerobaculia bacterium]|nr:autotransporter outer membrane beta-barrel domain-containing protein [Thermoanaerobaculia bacterium]
MVARVFASAVLLLTATSALAQSPIEGVLQDLAANEAQREIGRLVENICPTGQINDQALQSRCNEIVGNAFEGNSELVRGSLQALAPEENLVVGSALVDPSVAQVDVVQQRLATLRSGAGGGSAFAFNLGGGLYGRPAADLSPLAFASLGLAPKTASSPASANLNQDTGSDDIDVEGRWGFFANGTASSVDRDQSARVSGFEADLSGVTLGLDYRVTSAWVLGGAVGY